VFCETGESGVDFQFISISKDIPEGRNLESVGVSKSVIQRCKITVIETKLSEDLRSL